MKIKERYIGCMENKYYDKGPLVQAFLFYHYQNILVDLHILKEMKKTCIVCQY